MNTVHVERLRTLYALMAGIPAERVNLSSWREAALGDSTTDASMLEHGCGSTGCAVGWACAYPPFIEQGLYWGNNEPALKQGPVQLVSWYAVNSFFGLSGEQGDYLFMPSIYCHPQRQDDRESSFSSLSRCQKRLVLARIRYHLLVIGAITRDRYFELARQEARETLTP